LYEGVILGILSWLSLVLSWQHLPRLIKSATKKHPLISDLVAIIIAYLFLSNISKSIIAVIGAITAGVLVNITLIFLRRNIGVPTTKWNYKN